MGLLRSKALRRALLKRLDMSTEARMERAKAQGFGDEVLYHGTGRNFSAFANDAPETTFGTGNSAGTYLSRNVDQADAYARTHDFSPARGMSEPMPWDRRDHPNWAPQIMPLRARQGRTLTLSPEDFLQQKRDGFAKARAEGYDSVRQSSGDEVVIFDPSNIRSVHAAFDPRKKNSRNLLAGTIPAAVGAGLLSRQRREES